MEKLLEVREFDWITGNPEYQRDEHYKYLPSEAFSCLMGLIHTFSGDQEQGDALDFLGVSCKRNVGDVVLVRNYVGLIQMQNGYQIQILPKISFGGEEDVGNLRTKRIFLKMLCSMKDFPGKVFQEGALRVQRMNLYEIFLHMYLQEVRLLVKHGLKSAYIPQEDNLHYYKGKLKISQHIRVNPAHRERFYVGYDEFHLNRPENRLIKATLLKLQKLTTSGENSKMIRQLLTAFEMVEPSVHYEKDFSRISIDRNTRDYEALMQWSRVFLMNQSFTPFSGDKRAKTLLFPMERVFESYVAQEMKKVMGQSGWTVSLQDRGYYLFTEPRKQFVLRPDMVLKKDGRTVILDTKWKRLIPNEGKNYGISQADMYQMYAYSKKYGTAEIWLLYPRNDEMREVTDIRFDSGDGTTVAVFFVDVADMENSLEQLRGKLEMESGGF